MHTLNSKQTFIIFCVEAYKNKNKIEGKKALYLFKKYKVFDFLENFYDILHTQSMDYIIEEINKFIRQGE